MGLEAVAVAQPPPRRGFLTCPLVKSTNSPSVGKNQASESPTEAPKSWVLSATATMPVVSRHSDRLGAGHQPLRSVSIGSQV